MKELPRRIHKKPIFVYHNNISFQTLPAYCSYTDSELTTLLQQGSDASFTEIFTRYWDKLYFLAHKHLKSSHAAEEIVQDVFMALWQKRAILTIQSLPLYLAAMTRYAVYRNLAWQKKYEATEINELRDEPATTAELEAMDNRLLLEIIEKQTNFLPEKCRIVFIQNKLLDIPLQQVAEELNISTKTAEAHLTKALKSMRANLGDAFTLLFIM